jgi:hypothetical protein
VSDTGAVVFFTAAILLVASGIAKLRRPEPAARVLEALGLGGSDLLARVLGLTELAIGVAALTAPSLIVAVALACLYGAFTSFLLLSRLGRVQVRSCGCLGEHEAPVSALHIALNLTAIASAFVVAVEAPDNVASFGSQLPADGVSFYIGLVTLSYLAYAAVAYAPTLFFSFRATRTADLNPEERSA